MSTIKPIFFILVVSLVIGSATAADSLQWDFRDESVSADDWLETWKPMTDAARHSEAVTVNQPPGQVEANFRALVIEDVYDSSSEDQTDEAGTPVFSAAFEAVAAGTLSFRAGTSGTQNQNATLTLLANGRPLLLVRLIDNTNGVVVSREGSKPFEDAESWFNRARDFEITWTPAGDVALFFTNASGSRIDLGPLHFLAPGSPDEIQLQVGFGRATGKAFRIEAMNLKSQE